MSCSHQHVIETAVCIPRTAPRFPISTAAYRGTSFLAEQITSSPNPNPPAPTMAGAQLYFISMPPPSSSPQPLVASIDCNLKKGPGWALGSTAVHSVSPSTPSSQGLREFSNANSFCHPVSPVSSLQVRRIDWPRVTVRPWPGPQWCQSSAGFLTSIQPIPPTLSSFPCYECSDRVNRESKLRPGEECVQTSNGQRKLVADAQPHGGAGWGVLFSRLSPGQKPPI
jgi:hypothetical protein